MKKHGKNNKPSAFKLAKIGATNAVRKAKAFVVYSIDYDNNLHVESNTLRALDETDIRQMSVKIIESYARNLSLTAHSKYRQAKESAEQSKMTAEAKEKRSIELARS